jgi:hypothetical protein
MYSGCIVIYITMFQYSYESTHAISGLAAGGAWEQLGVRLKKTIEWTQRCTGRPWSSEFRDAIGCQGRVNSEMHFHAVIEQVWRGNWRQRLSELGVTLCGCDQVSFRCTWRPRLSKQRDSLRGHDWSKLLMDWEAVIDSRLWRCTWRWRPSGLRDVLWYCDWASLMMQLVT